MKEKRKIYNKYYYVGYRYKGDVIEEYNDYVFSDKEKNDYIVYAVVDKRNKVYISYALKKYFDQSVLSIKKGKDKKTRNLENVKIYILQKELVNIKDLEQLVMIEKVKFGNSMKYKLINKIRDDEKIEHYFRVKYLKNQEINLGSHNKA